MACFSPIPAWQPLRETDKGTRPLTFREPSGASVKLEVGCGKCPGCKSDHAMMWSIRNYHEASLHDSSSFLTLTYDDANLPQDGKVHKRELQLFLKKLRKKCKFRYFAVGEYGEETERPHFHALIFGHDFREGAEVVNDDFYLNQDVARIWGKGNVMIAPVTMASCCYVSGYVQKKQAGDNNLRPMMSRKPGIGHEWIHKYSDELRRNGFVVVEGRKLPIPLRYFDWAEKDDDLGPDYFADVKSKRQRLAKIAAAARTVNKTRSQLLNKQNKISMRSTKL